MVGAKVKILGVIINDKEIARLEGHPIQLEKLVVVGPLQQDKKHPHVFIATVKDQGYEVNTDEMARTMMSPDYFSFTLAKGRTYDVRPPTFNILHQGVFMDSSGIIYIAERRNPTNPLRELIKLDLTKTK